MCCGCSCRYSFWVVASTSRYCDAVVTQPGLNSFLLWSKSRENVRGTPFLITGWPLILTDGQERETIAKLRKATSVCAIYSKRLSDWWTLDGPQLTASTLARQPLVAYIRDLSPIQEVGDYEIRGNAAALGKWNVDYLLNGIRKIDGSRDAVGIPAGLLSSTDFKLIFEFQADQAGPLLSVQQSGAKSDEDTIATEPVTYIAQNGVLMIRKTAGAYSSSLSASVLDGLWHEISVQRDPQGWRMFLDGHPVGRTPELLTGADQPRYLQLGPAFGIVGSPLGQGWSSFFGQIRNVRVTKSAIANDQLSGQDVTALR